MPASIVITDTIHEGLHQHGRDDGEVAYEVDLSRIDHGGARQVHVTKHGVFAGTTGVREEPPFDSPHDDPNLVAINEIRQRISNGTHPAVALRDAGLAIAAMAELFVHHDDSEAIDSVIEQVDDVTASLLRAITAS